MMQKNIEIIFNTRKDAMNVQWLLNILAKQGCLNEKVKFNMRGADSEQHLSYKESVKLRTLSIKIED